MHFICVFSLVYASWREVVYFELNHLDMIYLINMCYLVIKNGEKD
jgi:hypothetical protein